MKKYILKAFFLLGVGLVSGCITNQEDSNIRSLGNQEGCIALNPERLVQTKVCQINELFTFSTPDRSWKVRKSAFVQHLLQFVDYYLDERFGTIGSDASVGGQRPSFRSRVTGLQLVAAVPSAPFFGSRELYRNRIFKEHKALLILEAQLRAKESFSLVMPLDSREWSPKSVLILKNAVHSTLLPSYVDRVQVNLKAPFSREAEWVDMMGFFPELKLLQANRGAALVSFSPFRFRRAMAGLLSHPNLKDRVSESMPVAYPLPPLNKARFFSIRL